LVRGAYLLTGFGAVATLWLLAHIVGMHRVAEALLWPGAFLAIGAAVYTAFLFAQAKGRDFWQNPLLPIHLLAHAALAGSAVWLLVDTVSGADISTARVVTISALVFSLITLLAEVLTTPPTADAHRAMRSIIADPTGFFWIVCVGFGHLWPLWALYVYDSFSWPRLMLAAVTPMILWGLYAVEHLWVTAPQRVPLS
jgi:formate-dependent nitrite reductase membrane component NrfD